jgi:hypothetical protein
MKTIQRNHWEADNQQVLRTTKYLASKHQPRHKLFYLTGKRALNQLLQSQLLTTAMSNEVVKI